MAQLSEPEILDAAVALLDDGPAALTMRSLAEALGVTAAALYYWFPAKEQLLHGVAAHVAERIVAPPSAGAGWQERVASIARAVVAAAQEHPVAFTWVFTNYAKKPPLARIDEAMVDALLDAGLPPTDAVLAKGMVWRLIVGHLGLSRVPAHIDPATVPADEYPRLHEVASASEAQGSSDYFEWGLRGVIAGVEAANRSQR